MKAKNSMWLIERGGSFSSCLSGLLAATAGSSLFPQPLSDPDEKFTSLSKFSSVSSTWRPGASWILCQGFREEKQSRFKTRLHSLGYLGADLGRYKSNLSRSFKALRWILQSTFCHLPSNFQKEKNKENQRMSEVLSLCQQRGVRSSSNWRWNIHESYLNKLQHWQICR